MRLFNLDTGILREDILIFKKHEKGVKYSESGNLYDRFGKILISGTFLTFERRKLRKETIIVVGS